jgi:diguanylate cyclase (GGDEF)-like protein
MSSPSTRPGAEITVGEAAQSQTDQIARRLRRRRRNRLQILSMVSASYAIDTALLLALYAVGAVALRVPLAYGAAGFALCGTFYFIFSSGWSERFKDHYLATPYLIANTLINLSFLLWASEIGLLFMTVLFIIFALGGLRMSRQSVLISATVTAVVVGSLIAVYGDALAIPVATWQQRLVSGIWVAAVLARSAMAGVYGAQMRGVLAQRNEQLAVTTEKLDLLAHRDELTGALNRRSAMRLVEAARQRMQEGHEFFAVALLDIDNFKQINDRFGHAMGDEALRQFTVVSTTHMRSSDRLGRYGGEEFLLLLNATSDEPSAIVATERVRQAVAEHTWSDLAPDMALTLSAGIAICRRDETAQQLLNRADTALYAAKREGRNCVRIG